MRKLRRVIAPAACALLSACDGGVVTAPLAALADDVQCPETNCGWEPPPPPPYYWGSDTSTSRAWKQFGTAYAFVTIHKGNSWSEVVSYDYASGRVDAEAFKYDQCKTSWVSPAGSASKTVYGVGKAEVFFRFEHNTQYGFQVKGTHTFVGRPGTYVGTQVFYSEASHCDNGIV